MSKDGGAAFPNAGLDAEPSAGMTLHQWFAGQALAGLLADPNVEDSRVAVFGAMECADVMIAAYKTKTQETEQCNG